MAGYLGTKAVLLSTTAADVVGNAEIGGDLTVGGNVGIGTSSVGYVDANRNTLQVNGTTSSIIALAYGGTNAGYMYANSDITQLWSEGSRELNMGTAGAGPITFKTNNTERMRIDPSGRVTMPYQPAFHAMAGNFNNISSGNLIYNSATFNTGNHYNTSTGNFTAPVAGVYQFHASCYSQSGTGASVSAKITVNGVMRQIGEIAETGGNYGYDGINMSVIVYLNVNDVVAAQYRAGGQLHLNSQNNSFSGALIG